jgi:hypothetical protein
MVKKHQQNITVFIRKVYYAYFGVKLGDQDKSWAPHKVCYVCVEGLRKWSKGKKKSDLVSELYGGSQKITVMIAIFAVAMLRVTTPKIRKLSCTRTFLQLYALLIIAQRYLYLSLQKY